MKYFLLLPYFMQDEILNMFVMIYKTTESLT